MKLADAPLPKVLFRVLLGAFFVAAGITKAVQSADPAIGPGIHGFAEYLTAAGIPFPLLGAYVVVIAETLSGAGLLLGVFVPAVTRITRVFALVLAIDMSVAIATVGLRTAMGNPVMVHGVAATNEPWRLWLELTMLLSAMFFLWKPGPARR